MRFTFPLFLFFLIFSCGEKSNDVELISTENHISEIKSKHVPDRRTSYFVAEAKRVNGQLVIKGETTLPQAKSELLEKLDAEKMSYLDSLDVLPSPSLEGRHFGIVNVSVCNIRSQPGHSAELGTQAFLGTPLRVWKRKGSFYFIQTPDNYFGWLDDGGLVPMTQAEFEEWQTSEKAVVVADLPFLKEKPEKNAAKISDLTAGGILQLIGYQGNFAQLAFPDGRAGFLEKSHLLPYPEWMATRQPTAENILASAQEFLGRPYLWGGTSGKGVDCSGFTKTVYYLNGIQLERDASLQVHTGELVETDTATWKNLLPGDLLFFGRHATAEKNEQITHVAIYIGDAKIIHAADRVQVESLRRGDPSFVEYRVKSFIRAKRMLGSEGKNGVIALRDSEWYK